MSESLKRLSPLIGVVQLQGVRLVESSTREFVREPEEGAEIGARLNWSAKAILKTSGQFTVLGDVEVLLLSSSMSETDAARVWARFELRYSVPESTELSEGLLEEFAKSNGVFNAWSYWREFIQSSLVRMELPPVALPMFRWPLEAPQPATRQARSAK